MPDKLTFHLCDTERGWVGLVLSPHGLRGTTLPRPSREDALREVTEQGADTPASDSDLADLPERVCALASGRYENLAVQVDWNRSEEQRLNSSHVAISYAVFCLKKKK